MSWPRCDQYDANSKEDQMEEEDQGLLSMEPEIYSDLQPTADEDPEYLSRMKLSNLCIYRD